MLDSKLISIIVPVYNVANCLDRCISSIRAQTYKTFELILVDDGSVDDSLEICRKHQRQDERISVIHQSNAGVSVARNTGLSLAKGDYFCFVDSDDEVDSCMLEKLYAAIEETSAELSICGFKYFSKKKIEFSRSLNEVIIGKREIADFIAKHYLEWLITSPCGKLYKNIQFTTRRFDPNISLGEDLKFNIEYFQNITKLVVIDECLYQYNDTAGSLTKTYKPGNFEATCDIYNTTLSFYKSLNIDSSFFDFKNINYKLFSCAISFMYQNMGVSKNIKESMQFILKVCTDELVQNAVYDLPKVSFGRRLYIFGIKHKYVVFLWLLSFFKYKVTRAKREINRRHNK